MDREEEKKCIEEIKKGNKREFEKIVNEYEKVLLHIAFYITGNKEDAKDLCQETFLRLFKYINSFIPKKGSIKGYLYKTIGNLCSSYLNKKKIQEEIFAEKTKFYGGEIAVEDIEIKEIILKLLKILTPKERIVFLYKEILELEYKEIAKILNIKEVTVRRFNSMAREKLKKEIEEKYPEYKEVL